MHKHISSAALLVLLLLASCAKISPQAITLTSTLDQAIRRLQTQTESLIHAAAAQQLAHLDDAWPTLYTDAESAFRQTNSLAPDAPLSQEHRATIAGIAAEAHDAVRMRIESASHQLVADAQHNTDLVLSINDALRNHLLSLASLQQSHRDTAALLETITEIPIREHWEQLTTILASPSQHPERQP